MVRVTFLDIVFCIHSALKQQWPVLVLSNIMNIVPPCAPFTVWSRPHACMPLNTGCEPIRKRDDVIMEKFDRVYFYAQGAMFCWHCTII